MSGLYLVELFLSVGLHEHFFYANNLAQKNCKYGQKHEKRKPVKNHEQNPENW